MDTYGERLANVLKRNYTAPTKQSADLLTLESIKAQPGVEIKLNEFYRLPECGIKTLIAERNTSLGKLQSESQRFIYDVELVQALITCQRILPEEFHVELMRLIDIKKNHASLSWRNMLDNSSELKMSFSQPGIYFGDTESGRETYSALLYLNAINQHLTGNEFQKLRLDNLETNLHSVSTAKLIAKLFNTYRLMRYDFDHLNKALQTWENAITCDTPKQKTQMDYLQNVFDMFFIKQIQPFAARLNRIQQELSTILSELYPEGTARHSLLNVELQSAHALYAKSFLEHVDFWQSTLAKCNRSPSR